ncbi:MAG: hypothetical protein J6Q68_05100 [Clostridia bacterium]|nr:hypothetical protein [Clostridia bacterium]
MKSLKLAALFATISAIFLFASCGEAPPEETAECTTHSDVNGDGICDNCYTEIEIPPCESCVDTDEDRECDVCGGEVAPPIELNLIENGTHNFAFVVSKSISTSVRKEIDKLTTKLKSLGYVVENLSDTQNTESDKIEILIGDKIESRGKEYCFDGHTLGPDGSAVKIVNGKIIIIGGSDTELIKAITYFKEKALGITDSTKNLKNAIFSEKNQYENKQTDFLATSVSAGGRVISDYVIAIEPSYFAKYKKGAEYFRDTLYERAGYWLEIVTLDQTVTDKYISITTPQKSGGEGFEIKIVNSNVEITCEFPERAEAELKSFATSQIGTQRGAITLSEMTANVRDIYYSEFGAIGDGVTDDFDAIEACHKHANEHGYTVCADSGAKYYIGPKNHYITVKTAVNWGNAEFTIDDSEITTADTASGMPIFIVENDTALQTISAQNSEAIQAINANGGIDASSFTKLDLGLGYPALVVIINSNHKNYIVYGVNANAGNTQSELVLIDSEGNIDPNTRLLFDYEKVTEIKIYPVDTKQITINGGVFTTIANQSPTETSRGAGFHRGIRVTRANTVVTNVAHYVVGEGEEGMPYSSFLEVKNTANVIITNSIFTGRKTYYRKGTTTGMGSYDLAAGNCAYVTWKNCMQSNFFEVDGVTPNTEGKFWGIMGSSACKNLTYDSCLLSRFDAHAGVYNTTIKDSAMQMFRIDGGGDLIFENVRMYSKSNTLISLREDYGAFWHGKITLKNVTMYNSSDVNLFSGNWYNHDFGYSTEMPSEIEIDGLKLTKKANVYVFKDSFATALSNANQAMIDGVQNVNQMVPTKKITIKNNTANYAFILPDKTKNPFFENTQYVVE